MQQKERKYLKCILNADDADFSVGQDEIINGENVRFGSTDAGVINTIESVGSTILKSSFQPSVSTVVIGSADDTANNRILYFVADLYGNDDKILCYSLDNEVIYTVLLNSQVTGGLKFDKNSVIHSARVVNGLLFWTDFLNQPRRLNINAGINLNQPGTILGVTAYTNPLTAEVITIIRKPPAYPITFNKIVDSDIDSNQIKNNAFRFTYFYIYRDGERSTLSPHSLLANYNYPGETWNSISLTISLQEIPDQDVQSINVAVIYAEGNNAFIIKTWNKANAAEAAEIAAHVAGTTALSFEFANDAIGEGIDAATLAKPFETVPLLSETLEQGTNRLFLGRNLLGYDTPLSSSLTAQVLSNEGSVIFGSYVKQGVGYSGNTVVTNCNPWYWYLIYTPTDIDGTHLAGYYDAPPIPLYPFDNTCSLIPSFPTEAIPVSDLVFIGTTQADVQAYIAANDVARTGGVITGRSFTTFESTFYIWVVTTSSITPNTSILKSDSSYRLATVFYDQYLRQSGVVLGPKVTTPDRLFADSTDLLYGVRWNLAAGAQPTEIPDWAIYYSIVLTKSLRTSFFVQARTNDPVYATKDADGNYLFTQTTYADDRAGVAVRLDLLAGAGMGYVFNEGDIMKVYISPSSVYTLAVIAQVGDYAIGELANVGDLTSATALFELYTPRPQNAAEFFYEIGTIYPILNPGTDSRAYSTLTEVLPGDVHLLELGTSPNEYLVESMSPNLTFWRNWFTNAGRIQIKDSIGQRFKDTSVKWSNTFIPGTITNGLSSFDPLDERILPGEMGPLRKLQITSKVNDEQGAVMLGICEDETASLYLGETQLLSSTGNAFIAQSTGVIGTVNILKGSFGTINPESVTEFRGNCYWADLGNGKIIQYSANGLFPISNYKMTRYWKLFSDQFMSMTQAEIEALGNRPFIFTTVDPHHWEVLVSVPKLLNVPPKGTLPDYPFINYFFDIWNGAAKTHKFKLDAEPNHWQAPMKFCAEGFITIQNKLFSFKNGQLYEHNSLTSQCVFYGTQEKARIMCLSNMIPQVPKSYNNMTIQANMKPDFVYLYNDYPYQQSSDLIADDFKDREGVFYSPIYRNKLIPTSTGYNINGLLTGEKMRAESLKIMFEFDVSQKQLEFRFVDFGFSISSGHTTIQK